MDKRGSDAKQLKSNMASSKPSSSGILGGSILTSLSPAIGLRISISDSWDADAMKQ